MKKNVKLILLLLCLMLGKTNYSMKNIILKEQNIDNLSLIEFMPVEIIEKVLTEMVCQVINDALENKSKIFNISDIATKIWNLRKIKLFYNIIKTERFKNYLFNKLNTAFKCKDCSFACSSHKILKQHIISTHKNYYKCKLCDHAYSSKFGLTNHYNVIHILIMPSRDITYNVWMKGGISF